MSTPADRSGEVGHTRTMRIAATVALITFLAGGLGFAITAAFIASR